MGLCKCPRRKMTNLFCYEHRVNVCENCLVESHEKCVVQSYLQWLSDSDYDTNCSLCEHPLAEAETIRLQCFHLFHWGCLDEWARKFPANTAPAGFRCPFCREALFPAQNQLSPILDRLREKLQNTNWARVGLGLPLIPGLDAAIPKPVFASLPKQIAPMTSHSHQSSNRSTPAPNRSATPATALDMGDGAKYSGSKEEVTFTARKKQGAFESDSQPLLSSNSGHDADSEANKYKRRPAREWLRGLWNAKYGKPVHDPLGNVKRTVVYLVLAVVAIFTLLVLMKRIGIGEGESGDPMFDPMANPNIRIAAEESRINMI